MLEKGLELTTVVFFKNLKISSYDIYQVNNSEKNYHVSNVFICITLGMDTELHACRCKPVT